MYHTSLIFGKYVYTKHLITAHRNLIYSDSLNVPSVGKQMENIRGMPVCVHGFN